MEYYAASAKIGDWLGIERGLKEEVSNDTIISSQCVTVMSLLSQTFVHEDNYFEKTFTILPTY